MDLDFDENALMAFMPADFEEKARNAFQDYDLNGDGRIDLCELYDLMKQISKEFNYTEMVTKEDVEKTLSELDSNQNGVLEYEEFRKLFIGLCVVREVNKNK
jgi:Ca2+-binding EF-hand superfamily protein